MRKSKKVIALILAIVTIFSAVSIVASAKEFPNAFPSAFEFAFTLGSFYFSSAVQYLNGDIRAIADLAHFNSTNNSLSGLLFAFEKLSGSSVPRLKLQFFTKLIEHDDLPI